MKWKYYNLDVKTVHTLVGDNSRGTDIQLPEILDAGVDILIYEGTLDYICGYLGVRGVIQAKMLLDGDVNEDLKDWNDGGGRYLCSKSSENRPIGKFCYLEIDGFGHGVAFYHPGWGNIFDKWVFKSSVQ
jgi:hypothetical protein